MKVLWFTNTPSLADKIIGPKIHGGGWIKSLESIMKSKVELNIAFYSENNIEDFSFEGTNYFPIAQNSKTILQKIKNSFSPNIEPESDIAKYLKVVNIVKPDIIHIHGTENPFGLLLEHTKIPIVISIQGNISAYRHKFFSGIPKKYSKISFGISQLFLRRNYFWDYKQFIKKEIREKRILLSSKYIIGRTSWDKRISNLLAPSAIYFHNDEILRESFYVNEWKKKNNEKFVIHTTSSSSFYKGIETIFQTVQLLNKMKINFIWKVAGIDENDRLIKTIKIYLKINKLPNNLKLIGQLDEDKLASELLNANLFVLPSHIENSPNSLCEPMILGMPCLTTNVGGIDSLINSEEGILVQDGEPYSMAGAILEICNNYDQAVSSAKIAREKALLRHSKKEITEGLFQIYQTIVSN